MEQEINPKFCVNCAQDLSGAVAPATGSGSNYIDNNVTIKSEPETTFLTHISVRVGISTPAPAASGDPEMEDDIKPIEQNISILDALSCIFPSIISKTESPSDTDTDEESSNYMICMKCGEALCGLYGAYFQLLNLSRANAKISQLLRQIELWHSSTSTSMNNEVIGDEPIHILHGYINALKHDDTLMDPQQNSNGTGSRQKVPKAPKNKKSKDTTCTSGTKRKGRPPTISEPQTIMSSTHAAHIQQLNLNNLVPQFDPPSFYPLLPNVPENNLSSTELMNCKQFPTLNSATTSSIPMFLLINAPQSDKGQNLLQVQLDQPFPYTKDRVIEKKRNPQEKSPSPVPAPPSPSPSPPPLPTRLSRTIGDIFKTPLSQPSYGNRSLNKMPWPRYHCTGCTRKCLFKWELELHEKNAHEKKVPDKCLKCKFLYYDKILYDNHTCITETQMHIDGLTFRCLFCGQGFKNSSHWINHRRRHEADYVEKEPPKPPPVQENDEIPYKTKEMIKRSSTPRYPCTNSECSKIFMYKWELLMHVRKDHENTVPDECEKCQFKYFDQKLFETHSCITKETRQTEELKFRCNYCGVCFKSAQFFLNHRRIHEEQKYTVPCTVEGCSRMLLSQKVLDKHIKIAHSGRPKKKYAEPQTACPECGKVMNRYLLKVHIIQKHQEGLPRNHVCHLCGMAFQLSSVLRTHLKIKHSEIRPYKCPLCNVTFKYKQCLKTHWKGNIHSKEEVAPFLQLGYKIMPNFDPSETPILPPKRRKRNDYENESSNSN